MEPVKARVIKIMDTTNTARKASALTGRIGLNIDNKTAVIKIASNRNCIFDNSAFFTLAKLILQ